MADSKISALPASTVPLAGTEVLPIVQSGATTQVTVANLTAGRAVATGVLSATGIVLTTDATDASSTTAASMKTAGGLAVVKKTYIGDNIVQGTAAKGINYTANTPAAGMTSQLLNWYEEGTFTPTIAVLGSGSITLNTATGKYTRIGRQVTVIGSISVLSVSAPTGDVQIGGFPVATGIQSTVALNMSGANATATSQMMGRLDSGQSGFYLFHFALGVSGGAAGDFKASTALQFSCTYFV